MNFELRLHLFIVFLISPLLRVLKERLPLLLASLPVLPDFSCIRAAVTIYILNLYILTCLAPSALLGAWAHQ
ncbi:hypothetical protein C8R41DRAFT_849722 [Lentinula lateritia]|uniref:Uncharacterized protein n=1 Tax=Lentinula lateritia TaxID=40482 RepID=A0ABQ8V766_9AGAR|nr:hypothetical protein C8R41DRAFT_849722 [Lentinula lateritia]